MSEQVIEQKVQEGEVPKKKRARNLYSKKVIRKTISYLNNPNKNEKQKAFLEKKGITTEEEIQKIFHYYINNTDKYKVDFLPSVSKKLIKLFLKKMFNPSEEVEKAILEFKVSKPITYLVTESAFEKEGELWIQQKDAVLKEVDNEEEEKEDENEDEEEENNNSNA